MVAIYRCVNVTRAEESVSQNHERHGTTILLDSLLARGLNVTRVAHDNNAAVTNAVKKKLPNLRMQLDKWHGVKNFSKALAAVATATGPKYKKDKPLGWSSRLTDQQRSLRNYMHAAVDQCGGSGCRS